MEIHDYYKSSKNLIFVLYIFNDLMNANLANTQIVINLIAFGYFLNEIKKLCIFLSKLRDTNNVYMRKSNNLTLIYIGKYTYINLLQKKN